MNISVDCPAERVKWLTIINVHMITLNEDLRVILIGGSSNVGKTTLAESLASKLGWRSISTDKLARHPGRPWKSQSRAVPDHVAEHYLSLSVDELLQDVLRHYERMWPGLETTLTSHTMDVSSEPLIFEGSALWPESVASLCNNKKVAAIWLTAGNELFTERIHAASQFEQESIQSKTMIQKFLGRTHLYNERMMQVVRQLRLPHLDIETASSLDELCDLTLALVAQQVWNPMRG